MLVRLSKDWKFPDIMRQTPGGKGEWNGIRFTEEKITEADVLVVLNRPHENIVCRTRANGTFLLSQESPIEYYAWHKKSFSDFSNVVTFWDVPSTSTTRIIHDQTALPWHIGKSYDELIALQAGSEKRDEVSWVTSNATNKVGHKLRLEFLGYLQTEKFPFHLFGRGFTPVDDKFDAIHPYKYSIAVENYSCDDYWTEKIADCLLSWTLPFYYGCSNILNYFPADAMIQLDPADGPRSMKIMQEAIANNEWEKRLPAIKEARELILNKYQFFPAMEKLIKQVQPGSSKVLNLIPGNSNGKLGTFPAGLRLKTSIRNIIGI